MRNVRIREKFFDSLHPKPTYQSTYNKSSEQTYNKNTTSTPAKTDDNSVSFETLKYITEKYDFYVETLKTNIQKKCEELNISFDSFKDLFNNEIKF